MTDFEKVVRYLCFEKAECDETKIFRYEVIERMVHGDTELIKDYARKYEILLDILGF